MINTTSIVELAIGLVFMFSLVAILVTQINGVIGSVLNLRSKQLKDGIEGLVTDPEIQKKLLSHPIINIIPDRTGLTPEQAEKAARYARSAVTYIPPSSFVEALISVLLDEIDDNVFQQLEIAINDLPVELASEKAQLLSLSRQLHLQISKTTIDKIYSIIYPISDEYRVYRHRLTVGMKAIESAIENLSYRSYQDTELIPILSGIRKVENKHFKNALQSVLTTARTMEDGRKKMESWFDDSMNRVSEMFERKLQIISFVVALVLVLLFNIDAVYVARVLLEDPELRQNVARAAQRYEREQQAQGLVLPSAGEGEATAQAAPAVSTDEIRSTAQSLLNLQLPIGWQFTPVNPTTERISEQASVIDLRSNPRNLWNLLPTNNPDGWLGLLFQKFIGLGISTIAAAQGAPFWFDLLRRISGR